MDNKFQHTAVIGFPLTHTLSPLLHNAIYKELGLNAEMRAIANPNIAELVATIRATPIALTAITIPHKETIMQYLDEVDEIAREIGAANTVINRDGKLYGYNTDVVGITNVLGGVALKNKNVLVVGAGGAARAAVYYIAKQGGNLYYCNRTREKAEKLQKEFGGVVIASLPRQSLVIPSPFDSLRSLKANSAERSRGIPFTNAQAISTLRPNANQDPGRNDNAEFDIIINTTPIGLYPNIQNSPLENFSFNPNQVVFDMVYNPRETTLLKAASAAGATTISGMEMFLGQALEQIRLWSGKNFPIEKARKILL